MNSEIEMADDISKVPTLSDPALRRALRQRVQFLPSANDRKFAQSLCSALNMTSNQRSWAIKMALKAERFRASGPKGEQPSTDHDIFADDVSAPSAQAPTTLHDALIAVDQDKLVEAMKIVMAPAITQLSAQVDERAQARQDTFERIAAGAIARQVLAQTLVELEKRKPREVVVKAVESGKTTQGKRVHPQFEHLVRFASIRREDGLVDGIFIAGEASSGKTTGCKMAAELLGLRWHFNGAISFPHEMLGFIDAAGHYHRTPFRDAFEHGGWYTFDEADRSDPVALLAVNPHLANGLGTFPDGQVKRHRDCIISATANTWGFGGDVQYAGATKLDAAFLSRFPRKLQWDIDPALEEALVGSGAWLEMVRTARRRAKENAGMKILIDMRHGIAGKGLLAAGYTLAQAAEYTYLAGLKPDQRRVVEGLS
jgi:hypothetical protein